MEYDDFYENYSEFDMQIDEFKSSLMKSVKQEFLDRMAKLEAQNLELEDIKEKCSVGVQWEYLKNRIVIVSVEIKYCPASAHTPKSLYAIRIPPIPPTKVPKKFILARDLKSISIINLALCTIFMEAIMMLMDRTRRRGESIGKL